MAQATYASPEGRINEQKGEILAHAHSFEVLSITGTNRKMARNMGDNVSFRRFLPYGAASTNNNTINRPSVDPALHMVTEGVTPTADTILTQDINVALQQYMCLYSYTDKTELLHEDDIPAEMKKQTGERMALLREMIKWGVLKGGTNAYYAGGTSRATVDETISYALLSKITRNLEANRAKKITEVLKPALEYDTSAVQAGYIVFAHTDLRHDIEQIPDFVPASKYGGGRKLVHKDELGSVGLYRFVLSPDLSGYADSGAAVAGTSLYSTTGTSADVYPFVVVGEEAWGDVALRGMGSFELINLPASQKDKSDPGGQRGYVGAKLWSAAVITNNGWMAVGEAAITAL